MTTVCMHAIDTIPVAIFQTAALVPHRSHESEAMERQALVGFCVQNWYNMA
jgi:hypothetical protein